MEVPQSQEILKKLLTGYEPVNTKPNELFNRQRENIVQAMSETGFYVWIGEDDKTDNRGGHQATYYKHPDEQATFIITRSIFGKQIGSTKIYGNYSVDGHEVSIQVDQEGRSSLLSHTIFIDGSLIAEKADPFSETMALSLDFVKGMAISNGEDPERFDRNKKSPTDIYVQKMLTDFSQAIPDEEKTNEMFIAMSQSKRGNGSNNTVKWCKPK